MGWEDDPIDKVELHFLILTTSKKSALWRCCYLWDFLSGLHWRMEWVHPFPCQSIFGSNTTLWPLVCLAASLSANNQEPERQFIWCAHPSEKDKRLELKQAVSETQYQGHTDAKTHSGHYSVWVCVFSPEHETGVVPVCTRSPPSLSPANNHSGSDQSTQTPSGAPCCVWPSASSPDITTTTTFTPTTTLTLHQS